METFLIVSVITSISALVLSVLTHIKTSSCRAGEFTIVTTSTTPLRTSSAEIIPVISNITPVINNIAPVISDPIEIPKLADKRRNTNYI
jgi:hypothetical protein